ncbi:MAG: hypothetical protein BroJett030_06110 [Alphaproteobacteria bacterium]|nr:MAG: hypothetical protein BroJett030_06110 [Alphaproteobacteria bacterium]
MPAAHAAIRSYFPSINVDTITKPRDFYAALGLTEYECIDLDGANDAHVFDLNKPLDTTYHFTKTFDLVTNHGTTEHAFDQFRCFENVHKLAKVGGLIIHALPSQGYQNHSFFNYHPSFFLDTAAANDYDVLGLYYNIGEELYPYTDQFLAENGVAAIENVAVFAIYRKTKYTAFVTPFDGRYYFELRDGEYSPRADVGSHSRVEVNSLPLSGRHYSQATAAARSSARYKIVLPVWGRDFIGQFVEIALRNQLQSQCIAFDERSNIEYMVVTDSEGSKLLAASREFRELSKIVKTRLVAADSLAGRPAYERLTESYNIALREAKVDDVYIFLTSDCFFSREVFHEIKRLTQTKRVVLAPALRVVEESFGAEVGSAGLFDLSGPEVLELALRHEHQLTRAFTINNPKGLAHRFPAQILWRFENGYVGRWTVMHPIAIRIANRASRITATIDWKFPLNHIKGWSDVAVLDSIASGLIVTLTPMEYTQGEPIRTGAGRRRRLAGLKDWVNIPWALNFHLTQVSHPVRLLPAGSVGDPDLAAAERAVAGFADSLVKYAHKRKVTSGPQGETTYDLLQPALDKRERYRFYAYHMQRALANLRKSIRGKVVSIARRAIR